MTMPLSFTPRFIGKLIKMQRDYPNPSCTKLALELAVQQCRNFNRMARPEQEAFFPRIVHTQHALARLGVVVG